MTPDLSIPIPNRKPRQPRLTDETKVLLSEMVPGSSILIPSEQANSACMWIRYKGHRAVRKKITNEKTRVWMA